MRDNGDSTNSRTSAAFASSRDRSTVVHTATQTSSSSPSGAAGSTVCAMIPRRYTRLALVTGLVLSLTIVYVTLFQHPPPEQLMKMNGGGNKEFDLRAFGDNAGHSEALSSRRELRDNNRKRADGARRGEQGEQNVLDMLEEDEEEEEKKQEKEEEEEEEKQEEEEEKKQEEEEEEREDDDRTPSSKSEKPEARGGRPGALRGKAKWDKFISENRHTAIGIVLDRCDQPSEQLGTVVLMPDSESGGVKSRTFYNFTLERDLEEGTFNIEVKYNGQDLYDNWWDICEMEEDLEVANRTFACPIKRGPISLVKDKHIPGYLPKGRYQSKAWVKDGRDQILVCGFSDFVL